MMNQPVNHTYFSTCTGTALVLLMQVSNAEILKTLLLASLGAVVSYLVSYLLKKLLK